MIISDGEFVNETLGKTLPLLTHSQMIKVTHMLRKVEYLPGQTVLEFGKPVTDLFLIESGVVDILVKPRFRQPEVIAQINRGEYFGEMEMLNGGIASAEVRVSGDQPVQLLALPADEFRNLLKDSPLTAHALTQVVNQRLTDRKNHKKVPKSITGGG
jgi:CRP-like cAMP-binding protein